MPSAQVYAPDPTNAATLQLLIKLHQQDEAANTIERGLHGMAASFGTAQQQHDAMASMADIPQQNTLGAIQQSLGIQREAEANAKEASARAGADVFGQQILKLQPGQGQELYDAGVWPDVMKNHFATQFTNQTLPDQVKIYNSAVDQLAAGLQQADPSLTHEAAVAKARDQIPPETMLMGPSARPEDRDYYAYAAKQRAAGLPVEPFTIWQGKQQAQVAATTEKTKGVADATTALPGLTDQLSNMQTKVDSLFKGRPLMEDIMGDANKRRIAANIFNWDGKGQDPAINADLYGLTPQQVTLVQNARQLHLQDYSANFKEAGKGQRLSQQEAKLLGNAADQLGTFTNPDAYYGALGALNSHIRRARATAYGEAQRYDDLPTELRGELDPSFFQEGSYNAGANRPEWARPKEIDPNDQAAYDALPAGQAFTPKSGPHAGKVYIKGIREKDFS
jgi:hypothetical protein